MRLLQTTGLAEGKVSLEDGVLVVGRKESVGVVLGEVGAGDLAAFADFGPGGASV